MNATGGTTGSTILGRPLLCDAFLADPYPTYQALRQAGPIHWSDEFFAGAWLLTRHADVEAVLSDPRFSAQRTGGWIKASEARAGEFGPFQQLFARAMLFMDGPDHARLRALLQPAFKPEALARLRTRIEGFVRERLDALDGTDHFDFMAEVARPLPVQVIACILGVETADEPGLMAWSDDLAAFIGALQPTRAQARRAQAGLLGMTQFFQDRLGVRRHGPVDGLLGVLQAARLDGTVRDDAELLAQCAMLLFAGHETTRNLLGNAWQALLSHPQRWQQLRQDPARIPHAVRELLRYDSPVQYTGRRVTTDLVLHGQTLRRGDLVIALIGAANRDPDRHARPDELDFYRTSPGALSFGAGVHACLGAALTRLEAEVVFSQLAARSGEWQLASAQPRWCANPAYRGLEVLPVMRRH